MSDDQDKSLEDMLTEFSAEKPSLENVVSQMDDKQFARATEIFQAEWNKRAPVKPSELNEAQFRELLRLNGVS